MWVIMHLRTTKSAVPLCSPQSTELGHQRRKIYNIVAIQKADQKRLPEAEEAAKIEDEVESG